MAVERITKDYTAPNEAQQMEERLESLSEISEKEKAKILLSEIAGKKGLPLALIKGIGEIINCESGWKHEGVFGDNGKAYGIAQFHKSTWDWLNKQRSTNLDYYSMEDQIDMLVFALTNGYGKFWTCFQ